MMGDTKLNDTAPTTDDLLRVLIVMAGRLAVPPDQLRNIVSPTGSQKYIEAYNLCDGTRGLSDVARVAGLDKSNLNKSLSRWVDAGVVFKVGGAPNLLHIYRLSLPTSQGSRGTQKEDGGIQGARAPVGTVKPSLSSGDSRTAANEDEEQPLAATFFELPLYEKDSRKGGKV